MLKGDKQTVQERLKLFLPDRNLRSTSERLAILEEAMATQGHISAYELHIVVKKPGTKISIYRALSYRFF